MQSSRHLERCTSDLLIGRASLPRATYFVTACSSRRRPGFATAPLANAIRAALDQAHTSRDFHLIAAVLMPDHVHILATLGERLSLARIIGKLKAQTRPALHSGALDWQENFYEHRLRSDDSSEAYARYLFLNPYRAGLVQLDQPWPYWWRWGTVRYEFEDLVAQNGGCPREWLTDQDPQGVVER